MSAKKEVLKVVKNFDLSRIVPECIKANEIDDSFFITNVGEVVKKFFLWQELFPRVDPFYAIKSNNLKVVATTLAALGTGFDCASRGEIENVLAMGVDSSKIVFAQTVKPVHNLKLARDRNVSLMTFDNEEELIKVQKHFPDAKLLLRLGFNPKSTNKISFGAKFGCSVDTGKLLLEKGKELNLNISGTAFHIGVGSEDMYIYEKAIKDSAEIFEYGKSLGFKMDLLDIGGGFPGHDDDSVRDVAKVINKSISTYFADPNIKIISEPGQFFAVPSMTLVVNVHSKTVKKNEAGEDIYHYYITDGIYQSFAMKATGGRNPNPLMLRTLNDTEGLPLKKSTIWGRSCDPNDQVESDILLPELQSGDWLILENFGGYRFTTSSFFNGFTPHPAFNFVERKIWDDFKAHKLPNIDIDYEVEEEVE